MNETISQKITRNQYREEQFLESLERDEYGRIYLTMVPMTSEQAAQWEAENK